MFNLLSFFGNFPWTMVLSSLGVIAAAIGVCFVFPNLRFTAIMVAANVLVASTLYTWGHVSGWNAKSEVVRQNNEFIAEEKEKAYDEINKRPDTGNVAIDRLRRGTF